MEALKKAAKNIDTGPVSGGINTALMKMERLKEEMDNMSFGHVDTNKMGTSLIQLKSKIQSLGIADIADVNVAPGRITTQLQFLKRMITQSGISDVMDLNINDAQLKRQLEKLHGFSQEIPVNFDVSKMPSFGVTHPISIPISFDMSKMPQFGSVSAIDATIRAEQELKKAVDDVNRSVADSPFFWDKSTKAILDYSSKLQEGSHYNAFFGMTLRDVASGIASSWVGIRNASASTLVVVRNLGRSGFGYLSNAIMNVAAVTRAAIGGGGGGIAGAGAAAAAAGGAARRGGMGFGFFGGMMGGAIGGIGFVHLALDLLMEAFIAVTLAAAAAAVGIAAMAPAAKDVALNLGSIQAVSSALGTNIPPLTGAFSDLAKSLAPQVIGIYGGALNLLKNNTGAFGNVAHQVTDLTSTWVAKIDLWNQKQGGMGKLLQSGVGFLSQFGSAIGHLLSAFDSLMKSDPGTAHFLLGIVDGASRLLSWVSKLPGPIIATGLAWHAFYLYGSVAAGLLARMPGLIGRVGVAIGAMTGPQKLALAAIAAVAFEMYRSWGTASVAISNDISKINASLLTMPASHAILAISQDIGTLNNSLRNNSVDKVMSGWKGMSTIWQQTGDQIQYVGHELQQTTSGTLAHQAGALVDAFKGIFTAPWKSTGAAAIQMSHDFTVVQSRISSLIGSQAGLYQGMGALMKQGYSFSQSLAILDMAGVRAGDSIDLINQKVKNLITGYSAMVGGGTKLINSINAINFASLQQQSQVATLNTGWDTFISTITGGETAMLTFATDTQTLGKNAGVTGASFNGLNAQSITLRNSFQTSATDANAYMDKLTLLASASGGGTDAINSLTQANKDLVAIMLPSARDSRALTSELYALAQRGGYTGANSFKELAKWVGNTKDPMKQLDTITGKLTTSAGNLTKDVAALSTALGQSLNSAMAQVIQTESGGLKPMENFYSAVRTTGINSNITGNAAFHLASQLYQLTRNVGSAHDEFDVFAMNALGLTRRQADVLWQRTLPRLQGSINALHGKNIPIGIYASGSGSFSISTAGSANTKFQEMIHLSTAGTGYARGGKLPGFGGGDKNLAFLEDGEAVVDKNRTAKYAHILKAMGVPGFAGGGLVGTENAVAAGLGKASDMGLYSATKLGMNAAIAFAVANLTNQAKNSNSAPYGGPGGGAPTANMHLAQHLYPAYSSGPVWDAWNYVAMRESGWNQFAMNPSSGAYGIAQALPQSKYPFAGQAAGGSNPTAQITWMWDYMAGRYGGPIGAADHERNFNWYDNGGWLKPGMNHMYNGTGAPELLANVTGSRSGSGQLEVIGGSSQFEKFMAEFIREFVRVKGGGDVQRAFGGRGK